MKRKKPGVFRALLPHLVLVLSAAMLTFFVIDRFNEAMAFLNNDLTKWSFAGFALASAILAVAVMVEDETRRKTERSSREEGSEGEDDGK